MKNTPIAGALAQVLAQTLASWALLMHLVAFPDVSIWVIVPLMAAIAVPFRHDGTFRDRALANFAAAVVASGILWWEVLLSGLDGLLGGTLPSPGPVLLLLLAGTVLFTLAGALFWLRRNEAPTHAGA
ncbi:MAG: hypothetical protein R3304_06735 [Longimicrobiales bacterium]|nr:hypothetical protein [Longimicrobiales bacterium]